MLGKYVAVKAGCRSFLTAIVVGSLLTAGYAASKPSSEFKADRIVIYKAKREMQLLQDGKVVRTYKIALGGDPVGPKQRQGDHRTPEGIFRITGRNANSKYHRSLRISYPRPEDKSRAAKNRYSPGGDIMIHGLPNGYGWVGRGHLARDWTDGCIAVTDSEIEEIWGAVPDGTLVEIKP